MLGVEITFLDLCQWDFEALWSLNRPGGFIWTEEM